MKKGFKKIIAFILSVAMVTTLLTGVVAFAGTENWQNAYECSGENSANYEMQVIVNPLVAFDKVSIQVGTWGGTVSHKVDIYAWSTDVSTSMAGTKLAYVDIPAGTDNTFCTGEVKNASTSASTSLPAGRYVFALSASNGATAWTIATNGSSAKQVVYGGGNVLNIELRMNLRFTSIAADGKYYGMADPNGEIVVKGFEGTGEAARFDKNAVRFVTKAEATRAIFKCANYGGQVNHIAKIYKWKGSYGLTMAAKELVARFVAEVGGDGGDHTGYFYAATSTNDTIDSTEKINLPAGDYLFVIQAHWNTPSNSDTSYMYGTNDITSTVTLQQAFTQDGAEKKYQFIWSFKFKGDLESYYGSVQDNKAVTIDAYDSSINNNGPDDKVYGTRVKTLEEMAAISAQRFTTSEYYFNIYKWEGSYALSIAKDPVSKSVLPASTDGGWSTGIILDKDGDKASPLPAGDYLIVFAGNPEMTATAYIINKQKAGSVTFQQNFKAGEASTYPLNMTITFSKKTENEKYLANLGDNFQSPFTLSNDTSWNCPTGILVDTNAKSKGISVQVGTWGGTVKHYAKVYAWDKDYATTIAGTVLAEVTIPAVADNDWGSGKFIKDSKEVELDPGLYLVVFTSDQGTTSYLHNCGTSSAKEIVFNNGTIQENLALSFKVNFAEEATGDYFNDVVIPPVTGDIEIAVIFAAMMVIGLAVLVVIKKRENQF